MPITHEWNGTILTITSDSGTSSCDLKGAKGDDGIRGPAGPAGSSVATDTQSLGGIAAENYALKTDIDYTGLATEDYVANAVSNIPSQAANLLDNSYFLNPVNQRGETTYSGAAYGIDRWKGQSSSTQVNLTESGLEVYNAGTTGYAIIYQDLPAYMYNLYKDKQLTVVECRADGTLSVISGIPSEGIIYCGQSQLQVSGSTLRFRILNGEEGTGLTIRYVALYEGAYTATTVPPYIYKGYGAELTECRRYYRHYKNILLAGVAHGTNSFAAAIDVYDMRTNPTVASFSVGWIDVGGSRLATDAFTLSLSSSGRINIGTTTAMTTNSGGAAYLGSLELSADL